MSLLSLSIWYAAASIWRRWQVNSDISNDAVVNSQCEHFGEKPSWTAAFAAGLRERIVWLTNTSAVVLVAVSFTALFARSWWLADICANLRIQWLIGLAAVVCLAGLQRRWRLVGLMIVAGVSHVPFVASAVSNIRQPNKESIPLFSVTTANVNTANRRYADIESELMKSGADVVAVLELSTDFHAYLQNNFVDSYPHFRIDPQNSGNFGIGLYSKIPFETARIDYFNDERISSVVAEFNVNNQPVTVIATHTLPPMGPGSFAHRNKHLRMLAATVNEIRAGLPETEFVVVGDLNLTPWSPIFTDFIDEARLNSSVAGRGVTPTWYRFNLFPFGLVLDHVLTSRTLTVRDYSVSKDVGSDHRFVTAELTLADQ